MMTKVEAHEKSARAITWHDTFEIEVKSKEEPGNQFTDGMLTMTFYKHQEHHIVKAVNTNDYLRLKHMALRIVNKRTGKVIKMRF